MFEIDAGAFGDWGGNETIAIAQSDKSTLNIYTVDEGGTGSEASA